MVIEKNSYEMVQARKALDELITICNDRTNNSVDFFWQNNSVSEKSRCIVSLYNLFAQDNSGVFSNTSRIAQVAHVYNYPLHENVLHFEGLLPYHGYDTSYLFSELDSIKQLMLSRKFHVVEATPEHLKIKLDKYSKPNLLACLLLDK